MKFREFVVYTLIFLLSSMFTINVVFAALTNKPLAQMPNIFNNKQNEIKLTSTCSEGKAIAGLDKAQDVHLRKLAEYQEACQSFVTDTMMIFTDMPKDVKDAETKAVAMAATLKEFSKYGVKPLVVVEPVTTWGLIDFQEFRAGFYDSWIDTYFKTLKTQGLTNEQMGMWLPFPEANLPYWNHQSAKPQDFAAIVNKYVSMQKTYFPQSKATILLNSATYATDDFDWLNGEYISFLPYVKDINKGLIDSFGMQGFPWMPNALQPGPGIFDASEFLNYRLVMEAAQSLGTNQVWFNTGTFHKKYASDAERAVTVPADKRKDVLNGIVAEAIKLRDRGYTTSINLFAEDKSFDAEGTDWSYWKQGSVKTSEDTLVFVNFAARLKQEKIGLSLFDKVK